MNDETKTPRPTVRNSAGQTDYTQRGTASSVARFSRLGRTSLYNLVVRNERREVSYESASMELKAEYGSRALRLFLLAEMKGRPRGA